MLVLTVTGMFKELRSGHKVPPIRYFFRTLIIVPAGAGFCILNEQVHISNATDSMAKVKLAAKTFSVSYCNYCVLVGIQNTYNHAAPTTTSS